MTSARSRAAREPTSTTGEGLGEAVEGAELVLRARPRISAASARATRGRRAISVGDRRSIRLSTSGWSRLRLARFVKKRKRRLRAA